MNIKQNYKKIIGISLIINVIVISLFTVLVLSPATNTYTISSGYYPSGHSYTFWREGSTYYRKNAYGELETSSNATALIESTGITTGYGNSLFFKNGRYEVINIIIGDSSSGVVGTAGSWTSIIGESQRVIFNITGNGNGIDIYGYGVIVKNIELTPSSNASAQNGVYIHNGFRNYFENVIVGFQDKVDNEEVGGFANAGFYIDGEPTIGAEENIFINCEVRGNAMYGFYFTQRTHYNQIIGGFIGGGWYDGGGWEGVNFPTKYAVYYASEGSNWFSGVSFQHSEHGVYCGVIARRLTLDTCSWEAMRYSWVNTSITAVTDGSVIVENPSGYDPAGIGLTWQFYDRTDRKLIQIQPMYTNTFWANGTSPITQAHNLRDRATFVLLTPFTTDGTVSATLGSITSTNVVIYHDLGSTLSVLVYAETNPFYHYPWNTNPS